VSVKDGVAAPSGAAAGRHGGPLPAQLVRAVDGGWGWGAILLPSWAAHANGLTGERSAHLQTPAEHAATQGAAAAFVAADGPGPVLQARLEDHRAACIAQGTSWLEHWWLERAYLGYRAPLPVHSNWLLAFCDPPRPPPPSPAWTAVRAAGLIAHAVAFKHLIDTYDRPPTRGNGPFTLTQAHSMPHPDALAILHWHATLSHAHAYALPNSSTHPYAPRDALPAERLRDGAPLDMSQFRRLFITCRVPAIPTDLSISEDDRPAAQVPHAHSLL
jgi:hypothetical protein